MALTSRAPRKSRKRRTTIAKPKTVKGRVAKKAVRKPRMAPGAARADAMVEQALAMFAHEVRTPLTGILAVSDLLVTSELSERERRWVETIRAGAEHLAGLATLFVDAARSHKARLDLRRDFFDLRTLTRAIGDSLAGRATAKGLQAVVTVSEKLPNFAVGDPVRLRAALENLIDNAVKFTDSGNVILKVASVRIAGKVGVSFAVSDSGIGLTPAETKKLFRPFSQANVSIAARFGGAGLGLFSVKQLARAMGGDIAATARQGGGTTFTLTVALDRVRGDIAQMAQSEQASAGGAGRRVLSVEDNPFGRVVLNAILTELGHHAEFIGRGEDAAIRVAEGGFDAVLMDMVLPDISGVEAIRQIRALKKPYGGIAVIGVSGRGEDEAAARQAGADSFLIKPVSPRALATALLATKRRSAAANG
ncbi:response regulator [Rhodopseudomonas boonkerdii]|uniref:ATP-binding protein n=1 Tax=Rhodopseudomonas boonkerdii TaxID=475937 RepID=UPI001E55CBF3|nr:ATP-binding protein [Rhodopseudomonas boonkerdii]UGV25180.1 response regulator [Rhodopseudomonas boonkerdii]